ncbi:MAG TPA: hypothetical protein VFG93_04375 [Gaiellaceae bacterium]|nr:hypothetical protein [Gaiellaceae bacterium]
MIRTQAIVGLLLAIVTAGAFAVASSAENARSTSRSGELHVTKDCDGYSGLAGQHCTITSSNLPAIKPGSKVIYASAAGDPIPGQLNSDLIIDGPGKNNAYGHVVLDLATFTGTVTLSGGTGKFRRFHARVAVTPLGWPNFAWDGTYTFGRSDDDD